jgi:hypothetical protein
MAAVARSRRLILTSIACGMLSASDVQAGPLVAQDLYTPGDGLVSRDAARGIDWLDLPSRPD